MRKKRLLLWVRKCSTTGSLANGTVVFSCFPKTNVSPLFLISQSPIHKTHLLFSKQMVSQAQPPTSTQWLSQTTEFRSTSQARGSQQPTRSQACGNVSSLVLRRISVVQIPVLRVRESVSLLLRRLREKRRGCQGLPKRCWIRISSLTCEPFCRTAWKGFRSGIVTMDVARPGLLTGGCGGLPSTAIRPCFCLQETERQNSFTIQNSPKQK